MQGSMAVRVVVLAGGVGGARFLLGVKAALGLPPVGEPDLPSPHEVTAVVNVGDDLWLHGLRICPDLDTCMYTLGGGGDGERGWGRAGESWTVRDELAGYGTEGTWFGLGDKDLATHLVRTGLLRAGDPLSAVTMALCERWRPGLALLPASDDPVETHVVVDTPDGGRHAIHLQEWWVRHRAELPAYGFVPVGADWAGPAPGVLAALAAADVVLFAPSNPVLSIGAILAVPTVHDALRESPAPVVGLSPIIAGKPVRGMADVCLAAIGVDSTAEAVGRRYGARSDGGLLDGWLTHPGDRADLPGVATRAVPLLMSDVAATAEMVRRALELAGVADA